MANVINATSTGNGGLITTGDDSGVLNIQTNETTAATIDASQNVSFTNGVNLPNTFGFKNRVINGNMVIDQRNNGSSVAGATGTIYPVDRFLIGVFGSGTGRMSGQRSTTVPSGSQFTNSVVATVTTADASPSSEYGYCMRHQIEGYNVADLRFGTSSASSITLSFWVRSSITGTYAVCFQNADVTRQYTATYTINSANTFEFKTITITGDTSGTWTTDNTMGLSALWCLGGGSNRQAPSIGAWSAGQAGGNTITDASGCVDFIGTSGATFYITGVQLEKGTQATSFDFRSIGTELALCQRYYYVMASFYIEGYANAGNMRAVNIPVNFPVTMRATPTRTVITAGSYTNVRGSSSSYAGLGINGLTATFASASAESAAAGYVQCSNQTESMSAEL
jgi:hypothetical protein